MEQESFEKVWVVVTVNERWRVENWTDGLEFGFTWHHNVFDKTSQKLVKGKYFKTKKEAEEKLAEYSKYPSASENTVSGIIQGVVSESGELFVQPFDIWEGEIDTD